MDDDRRTPLFFCDDVNVARELIKSLTTLVGNGVDVNHINDDGLTPLCYCCDINVVRELIESLTTLVGNGADVNYKNNNDETILFSCCDIDKCKLLISNGININHVNKDKMTFLEFMCKNICHTNYYDEIIEYLLEETDVTVTSEAVDLYYGNKEFYDQKVYDLLLSKEIKSTTKSANKINN